MKYKVGDKVRIKNFDWYNENKDGGGIVVLSTHVFIPEMSEYCGTIVTIKDVFEDIDDNVVYYIEENDFDWTDEMIEGLVEEECPQDFIEKYCNTCGTQRCDRTKEFREGCLHYNAYMCKKQNNVMEEETSIDLTVKGEEVKERIEIAIPEGYEYVIESGKIIFTKKKPKYPQSYEECRKIMDIDTGFLLTSYDIDFWKGHLLTSLQKLIICQDAYWKIAGDEMGLGKPWEPDWDTNENELFVIANYNGTIVKTGWYYVYTKILVFPTAEMRDAFYENFKEEIEFCKELL